MYTKQQASIKIIIFNLQLRVKINDLYPDLWGYLDSPVRRCPAAHSGWRARDTCSCPSLSSPWGRRTGSDPSLAAEAHRPARSASPWAPLTPTSLQTAPVSQPQFTWMTAVTCRHTYLQPSDCGRLGQTCTDAEGWSQSVTKHPTFIHQSDRLWLVKMSLTERSQGVPQGSILGPIMFSL